jgi:hypothetical protein
LSRDGRKAHRDLSVSEADELLRLARTSNLYATRGVGRDTRYADMWLATLKVVDQGAAVILVVSGNREFESEPRRSLLQFLQQRLVELRPRLERDPKRRERTD